MQVISATIPQAEEAWILHVTTTLSKKKTYHFSVPAYQPFVLMIFYRSKEAFHVIICFSHFNGVSDRYGSKFVTIVEQDGLKATLG
jgi:hypothetical protein